MHELDKDIPCIYFSSSNDGIITDVNEYLCRMLGYQRENLLGMKLENIFTLSTRIFQQTHFYPLLQLKGHAEEIYITLKSKDGQEVPVLVNAQQIEKNGSFFMKFAGISVSKRKKFEEEIIGAKKAAETALRENTELKAAKVELQEKAVEMDKQITLSNQQNQELRQFNHVVTHTLQELVRKINFYSNQTDEIENTVQSKCSIQKIHEVSEDMHAKLKGLQQYTWLTSEGFKFEKVDLKHLANEALKEVELQHPGSTIVFELEALPVIEANAEQMFYLLKEIFTNALKFSKSVNFVNIDLRATILLLNKYRQITGNYKYTEFLKLQIKDNGRGFDDKYQSQAFELFRQLHETDGQGIGLSLCRKIVENHGGTISLESKIGTGTTVVIFLPLVQ